MCRSLQFVSIAFLRIKILNGTSINATFVSGIEDLQNLNSLENLENKIDSVFSSMACHGSVRSGRILKYEEMDILLREMERTPNSDQCNHGRPTYLKLDLEKINKLFGRS